jgi:hypothetical protein
VVVVVTDLWTTMIMLAPQSLTPDADADDAAAGAAADDDDDDDDKMMTITPMVMAGHSSRSRTTWRRSRRRATITRGRSTAT